MEYYGNNDYRDYLAHHGIVGMKWGIRRYQSYATKPRGSGKGGKEMGEAKRKAKGQEILEKTYNKSARKLEKYNKKFEKRAKKAEKHFVKASVRLNGFSPFGIRRTIGAYNMKAGRHKEAQAAKYAYKGNKWYNAMVKNYGRVNHPIDARSAAIGARFASELGLHTHQMAAASYGRRYR